MIKISLMNSMKKRGLSSLVLTAFLFAANVDAAVSLVGSAKTAKADAGTMTVTAPSSTAAGDVMILFLGTSDTTPLTALSGWTQIMTKGPDDIALTSLYRVYRSGDSKTINVTVKHCSFATVIALRGVDQSNPIVDKKAYKDWGTTSLTENGTGTPKGTSYAPSINSLSGGALVCGFMWDDPYHDCTVAGMSVLHSYANADDGLTVAYQNLSSGGSTGMRKAVAPHEESGGGNDIGMAVSVRAAATSTTTVPWVTNLTEVAAGTAITNAGLTVSGVSRQYHATVAAGKVFSQTPGGNTTVARGSSVALAVSLGPQTVPSVPAVGSIITLTAVNGKYVSATYSTNNTLIANKTTLTNYERFKVVNATNSVALQCMGNNKFVSIDALNGSKPMVANRSAVGSYEKFKLVLSGSQIAIQSVANTNYVSAISGGAAPLQASQTYIGSYEKYTWKVE